MNFFLAQNQSRQNAKRKKGKTKTEDKQSTGRACWCFGVIHLLIKYKEGGLLFGVLNLLSS